MLLENLANLIWQISFNQSDIGFINNKIDNVASLESKKWVASDTGSSEVIVPAFRHKERTSFYQQAS